MKITKLYKENYKRHVNFLQGLLESTQSSIIRNYINKLLDDTNKSFNLYVSIENHVEKSLKANKKDWKGHKKRNDKFKNALNLPSTTSAKKHSKYNQYLDQDVDRLLASLEENLKTVESTKHGGYDMLVKLASLQDDIIDFLGVLDRDILVKFLELTQKPLFERIYNLRTPSLRGNISREIMISIIKYGIEKLGITGKAEAELIHEISSLVNQKKFILGLVEQADNLFIEILEPYEESLLAWIGSNEIILNGLEKRTELNIDYLPSGTIA